MTDDDFELDLSELTSAEDFLEYFGIDYVPSVVQSSVSPTSTLTPDAPPIGLDQLDRRAPATRERLLQVGDRRLHHVNVATQEPGCTQEGRGAEEVPPIHAGRSAASTGK